MGRQEQAQTRMEPDPNPKFEAQARPEKAQKFVTFKNVLVIARNKTTHYL